MHQKLDWGHWFKHLIPPLYIIKNPLRTPPVQYLRHTDQSITIFTLRTWNRILHSENHSYRPPPLTYSPPRHGPGRLEADSLHHLVQCKY